MSRSPRRPASEPPPSGAGQQSEADQVAVAREIALRRLTVRARTRQELEHDLAQRRVPGEVAQTVLDRFEEVGLIDDGAFAHAWVRSRHETRKASKSRMRQELRAKGVADEEVADALDQISPEADAENARALATRRLRTLQDLDPKVRQRRLAGYLARRGFSTDVVLRVLRDLESELDETSMSADDRP